MKHSRKLIFNSSSRACLATAKAAKERSKHRSVRRVTSACLVAVATCASQQALATGLIDLSVFGGGFSDAYGINAAGDVVVGYVDMGSPVYSHAIRWTAAGMTDLGLLPGGGAYAVAYGVNAAGDVIVGSARIGGINRAFRWTAAGMTDLGTLPGGSDSDAYGVNAAGDVIVGSARMSAVTFRAFRWTAASNTMTDLGTLGGSDSSARDVNAAGDVVIGTSSTSDNFSRAFRWTAASDTMTDLGTLGGSMSYGYGVNAAGDVIVGQASTSDNFSHAFRWTAGGALGDPGVMTDLGTLGGDSSAAYGVNAAGDVVVGQAKSSSISVHAFRWTANTGMQSIEQWLAANGVTVTGEKTASAQGVNADGSVVVGTLNNNRAFIARVTDAGSGMIDVSEFAAGLYRVADSAVLASNDTDLVMHGAHGSPMRTLLPVGRSSVWVNGDIGRRDHSADDSKQGVAEVGYGYRFNESMQLNMAVGRTYSKADTGLGGATTARSTYVLPELIVSRPDMPVFATLSAYYSTGDLRINRAYLNAGTLVHASGDPGVETWGARVRLDWKDAAALGKIRFTPYTSLTYTETRLDGYTERDGGFPVVWNARTEHATTARMGVDAAYQFSDAVTVLGRLEGVHRFEGAGTKTSGQVVGLGGFSFPGRDLKQDWLRVGLGLEGKVGGGVASVMLNATTQGEAPSYWLAAGYRWMF